MNLYNAVLMLSFIHLIHPSFSATTIVDGTSAHAKLLPLCFVAVTPGQSAHIHSVDLEREFLQTGEWEQNGAETVQNGRWKQVRQEWCRMSAGVEISRPIPHIR